MQVDDEARRAATRRWDLAPAPGLIDASADFSERPMDLVPPDSRLTGHWRRSLLATAGGRRDTTTWVSWLQAGEFYVDLRLPMPAVDRPSIRCLRDLDRTQILALARVEGFAGRLGADGGWARWERLMDLRPAAPSPDEGRLTAAGDRVVETGRDGSYIEHWHRLPGAAVPLAAALLRETSTGATAVLVRVGRDVAWARGRARPLPPGGQLADHVAAAATMRAAQDLLDTEVAIGRIGPLGAVLTRSSLPWRTGARLRISAGTTHLGMSSAAGCGSRRGSRQWASEHRICTDDMAPDGRPVRHIWQVLAHEGDLAHLPVPLLEAPA